MLIAISRYVAACFRINVESEVETIILCKIVDAIFLFVKLIYAHL